MHPPATRLIALSLLTLATQSPADEHHHDGYEQHGAHVHGEAQLLLAIEGNDLDMEFRSPAFNIVGFEHAPANEAQQQAVADAMKLLRQPDRLFSLPPAAGCQAKGAKVDSPLAGHGHEHENEHGHEHEHHAGDDDHSDFTTYYHFKCRDTGSLHEVAVNLFRLFPGTAVIEVQSISPRGQHSTDLTPDHNTLQL